jgi:hypothetical protein
MESFKNILSNENPINNVMPLSNSKDHLKTSLSNSANLLDSTAISNQFNIENESKSNASARESISSAKNNSNQQATAPFYLTPTSTANSIVSQSSSNSSTNPLARVNLYNASAINSSNNNYGLVNSIFNKANSIGNTNNASSSDSNHNTLPSTTVVYSPTMPLANVSYSSVNSNQNTLASSTNSSLNLGSLKNSSNNNLITLAGTNSSVHSNTLSRSATSTNPNPESSITTSATVAGPLSVSTQNKKQSPNDAFVNIGLESIKINSAVQFKQLRNPLSLSRELRDSKDKELTSTNYSALKANANTINANSNNLSGLKEIIKDMATPPKEINSNENNNQKQINQAQLVAPNIIAPKPTIATTTTTTTTTTTMAIVKANNSASNKSNQRFNFYNKKPNRDSLESLPKLNLDQSKLASDSIVNSKSQNSKSNNNSLYITNAGNDKADIKSIENEKNNKNGNLILGLSLNKNAESNNSTNSNGFNGNGQSDSENVALCQSPRLTARSSSNSSCRKEKKTSVGYRLGKRKLVFEKRRQISDYALIFAMTGVLLMIVETEFSMSRVYTKVSKFIDLIFLLFILVMLLIYFVFFLCLFLFRLFDPTKKNI